MKEGKIVAGQRGALGMGGESPPSFHPSFHRSWQVHDPHCCSCLGPEGEATPGVSPTAGSEAALFSSQTEDDDTETWR